MNPEQKKTLLFSISACLVAASYAILRPLKISIFFHLVGREYYPSSKILSLFISIPLMLGYSKMVDTLRKDRIFCVSARIYSVICLIFFLIFSSSSMGLNKLQAGAGNIHGWIFLGIMDLYPTFVIGGLWAFINSVSSVEYAQKNYGFITAFVKIGGILAAGTSLMTLHFSKEIPFFSLASEYSLISFLVLLAAFMVWLSCQPILACTKYIKQDLPANSVYSEKPTAALNYSKQGIFSGIKIMATSPYVFGIFLLFFFYEASFTVIEFQSLLWIPTGIKSMINVQLFATLVSQGIGLLIAYFITPSVLKNLKMSLALLITPSLIFLIMTGFYAAAGTTAAIVTLTLIPAIHFGLNTPTREMLFIPTTKNVQFKSKAWIDSLGRMLSKSCGLSVNECVVAFYGIQQSMIFMCNSMFLSVLILSWAIVCLLTGKNILCSSPINKKYLPNENWS